MRCWPFLSPCLLLLACAEAPKPDVAPEGFGVAVRHNIEAQIANPDRQVETLGPAPGERRAIGAARYQTDQVEAPVEVFTRGE